MSLNLNIVKNIRVFPTARAIKRLNEAGYSLYLGNKPLNVRGRIGAGEHISKVIRTIGTPEIIKQFPFKYSAIILDGLSEENLSKKLLREKTNFLLTTKWLVEEIKETGSTRNLSEILKSAKISQREMGDMLAKELLLKMQDLALKTGRLSRSKIVYRRRKAERIIQNAAKDFIELANLSEREDEKFVNFLMNILIGTSFKHFPDTLVHEGVVAFYSATVGAELNLSFEKIQRLKTAGLLHDTGKIGVPSRLMSKKHLSPREINILYEHLPIGVHLFRSINLFKNVWPIIQHHHDRNKNYPAEMSKGKKGLSEEILETVDSFDGKTSPRQHKTGAPFIQKIKKEKRVIKIFSKEEALELLEKKNHNPDVLKALRRVLERGDWYIYNLKKYFRKEELRLVWFGIEHLIKKSILPYGEREEEDPLDVDSYLRYYRPLLWLISERVLEYKNATDFIEGMKNEIHEGIKNNNLKKQFSDIEEKFKDSFLGPIYIVLYRAFKVDEKKDSQIFSKLIEIFYSCLSDPDEILSIVDSFQLAGRYYTEEFFEWSAKILFEEDASNVPVLGENAFIATVNGIYKYIFK